MRLSRSPILLLVLATALFGCSKSTSPTAPTQETLTAESLSRAGWGRDSTHVLFSGTLTTVFGDSLTVGGRAVKTDSQTRVARGRTFITVADLVVGDSLIVAGSVRPDNSVLARAILVVVAIPHMQFVTLADTVTAVSVPDSTFAVGDSTVHVNFRTRFTDHKTLADLKVGDPVKVLAVRQTDGSLLAAVVKIGDGDDGDGEGHGDDGDHDGGEQGGHPGDDDGGHGQGHDKGHGHH